MGGRWVQAKKLIDKFSIWESLLNRNSIDPFLSRVVTDYEKWVTYDNVKRKWSCSHRGEPAQMVATIGLMITKDLLSVWWDWQRIIYYKLLPYG